MAAHLHKPNLTIDKKMKETNTHLKAKQNPTHLSPNYLTKQAKLDKKRFTTALNTTPACENKYL